jgi:hypothetical protein
MSGTRFTAIEEMGLMETASKEELWVNLDKERGVTTILLTGLFCIFGIGLVFSADSPLGAKIGVIAAAILIIGALVADYRKDNPRLVVNKHGIYFNSKEYYPWAEIGEIFYETDGDGGAELVLYLHYKVKASFKFGSSLDHSIDTIAAYINKYWKKA